MWKPPPFYYEEKYFTFANYIKSTFSGQNPKIL